MKNILCLSLLFVVTVLFSACIADRSSISNNSRTAPSSSEKSSGATQTANENKTQNSVGQVEKTNSSNKKLSENKFDDKTENSSESKIENRCGWYENPTPGNHWLTDKDGEWTIGTQGGFQADGDYPPEFSDDQWVKTNVNYGYGCACLRVQTNKKEMQITKVVSATARPLSACRNDKALKEPAE